MSKPTTTKKPQPAYTKIRCAGFYRIAELALPVGLTGLARSTIYALAKSGDFPRPVKQGASALWPAPAVNAWLAARGALPAEAA